MQQLFAFIAGLMVGGIFWLGYTATEKDMETVYTVQQQVAMNQLFERLTDDDWLSQLEKHVNKKGK